MSKNVQLLKQVRRVVSSLAQSPENAENKVVLSIAEMFLNELMLQEQPAFYVEFLDKGKALLRQGIAIAAKNGKVIAYPEALQGDLHDKLRIEAIDAEINALNDALLIVVAALDESRSVEEKDFMVRLADWESSLYARRTQQVVGAEQVAAKEITKELVEAYLQKKHPEWKGLKVTQFITLEGGISKKTILLDIEDAVNGKQSIVLRAEQPVNLLFFDGSDVAQEFYAIALMHKLGMPVPRALWLEEDTSHLGCRFIVTSKSPGKTFLPGLASLGGGQERPQEVVDSLMQVLCQMHGLKPDPADPLVQKSHFNEWMPHKTIREVALYNARIFLPKLIRRAGIRMTPQLLRTLQWLEKNVPDSDDTPVVVHVDYAFNNLLFENNRVSAVLDWETSRMGDPADDILWTQQNLDVYSMPEFLRIYEQATGNHVTEYRMAYARVQKCVLNVIAGLTALEAIDADEHAPLHMGVMAFKYMPLFGADMGRLIVEAEKVRAA